MSLSSLFTTTTKWIKDDLLGETRRMLKHPSPTIRSMPPSPIVPPPMHRYMVWSEKSEMKKKKLLITPTFFLSFQKLFKCLRSKTKLPVMNTYVDVNNNLVLYITLVQLVNLTHLEVKQNTKLFFTPQKFEPHRYLGCSHQPQCEIKPAVHLLKKDLK